MSQGDNERSGVNYSQCNYKHTHQQTLGYQNLQRLKWKHYFDKNNITKPMQVSIWETKYKK